MMNTTTVQRMRTPSAQPQVKKWYIGQKAHKIRWFRQADDLLFATSNTDDEIPYLTLWKLGQIPWKSLSSEFDENIEDDDQYEGDPASVSNFACSSHITNFKCFDDFSTHSQGPKIVAAFENGEIAVFATNQHHTRLGNVFTWKNCHRGPATSVDVYKDGMEIASAGEDGIVNTFKLGSEHINQTIHADSLTINSVKYISSNILATVSTSAFLKLWDTRESNGRPKVLKDGRHGVIMNCIATHPHQPDYIATSDSTGCVSVWDTRKEQFPINRTKGHSSDVWEVSFHPSVPNYLFTCSQDGTLVLWDFNASRDVQIAPFTSEQDNVSIATMLINRQFSVESFDVNPTLHALVACTEDQALFLVSTPDLIL